MASSNPRTRYGTVAMSLHWLIALAIIFNICLGLYVADLPDSDPSQFAFVQFHKSTGLTILMLSLVRLAWRLVNPVPPLPATMSPALKFLARGSHVLLYVLIIGIPLSGWAWVSVSRLPTVYFGFFPWPHLPVLTDLSHADKVAIRPYLKSTHVFLAWSAIVLVPIHVLAALYHQFIRRDDVLRRMLPGTKVAKVA